MDARRRIPHRLAIAFLGFLLISAVAGTARADGKAAGTFLASLTKQAIEQLSDTSMLMEERETRFRVLFRANFDVSAIGRFVLGRYWRRADKESRAEFLTVFEDVMVQRFAPQFAGYAGTGFVVGVVRPLPDKGQFIVSSTIKRPKKETLAINWRIREHDGRFTVLDVIGEGVSMALTLRSEYASVIKSSGGKVEGLTTVLRDRTAGNATPGTTASAAN